jgi:hypothetical protein
MVADVGFTKKVSTWWNRVYENVGRRKVPGLLSAQYRRSEKDPVARLKRFWSDNLSNGHRKIELPDN